MALRTRWLFGLIILLVLVLAGCGKSANGSPARFTYHITSSHIAAHETVDITYTVHNIGGKSGRPWCSAISDDRQNGPVGVTDTTEQLPLAPGSTRTVSIVVPANGSDNLPPVVAQVVCDSTKAKALNSPNFATFRLAPANPTTPATRRPLGKSLAQEEAFFTTFGLHPISWKSAPLSGGVPRWLGSDDSDLLTFELIGPSSNLTQVDVEAFLNGSTVTNQIIAIGEVAYQFVGKSASMWVAKQVSGAVVKHNLRQSRHTATFGKYKVEVQTTPGVSSAGLPPTAYVQVTRA